MTRKYGIDPTPFLTPYISPMEGGRAIGDALSQFAEIRMQNQQLQAQREAAARANELAQQRLALDQQQFGLAERGFEWEMGEPERQAAVRREQQKVAAMAQLREAAMRGDFDAMEVQRSYASSLGISPAEIGAALGNGPLMQPPAPPPAPPVQAPQAPQPQAQPMPAPHDTANGPNPYDAAPASGALPSWSDHAGATPAPMPTPDIRGNGPRPAPMPTPDLPSNGPRPAPMPNHLGRQGRQLAVDSVDPWEGEVPAPSSVSGQRPPRAYVDPYAQAGQEVKGSFLSQQMMVPRAIQEAAANRAYEVTRAHRGAREDAVAAGQKAGEDYISQYLQQQRAYIAASAAQQRLASTEERGADTRSTGAYQNDISTNARLSSITAARHELDQADKLVQAFESGDPARMAAAAQQMSHLVTGETRQTDQDVRLAMTSINAGLVDETMALVNKIQNGQKMTPEMRKNALRLTSHFQREMARYITESAVSFAASVITRPDIAEQDKPEYIRNAMIKSGWKPRTIRTEDGKKVTIGYQDIIDSAVEQAREMGSSSPTAQQGVP